VTPNVRRKRRQFGWVFIPVMLLTGVALGALYRIWTIPDVVDRVLPSEIIAGGILFIWSWVLVTLRSYRNSVKLSKIYHG